MCKLDCVIFQWYILCILRFVVESLVLIPTKNLYVLSIYFFCNYNKNLLKINAFFFKMVQLHYIIISDKTYLNQFSIDLAWDLEKLTIFYQTYYRHPFFYVHTKHTRINQRRRVEELPCHYQFFFKSEL